MRYKKKNMSNVPMVGGDLILSDGSSVSTGILNEIANKSGISSFAHFSSFQQVTTLTTDQISALIKQIDGLIANENKSIIDSQSQITALQTSINNPVTGYQAIYNSTTRAYSTAVYLYYAQRSIVDADSLRLSTLYDQLSSVVVQENIDISTLVGLEAQYSTFVANIEINNTDLNRELQNYETLHTTMESYESEYSMLLSSYTNTTDEVMLSTLSSMMTADINEENRLQPYIISTLLNISTLSFLSTTYWNDMTVYTSSYGPYGILRDNTLSTIKQLMIEQASLTAQIGDYDSQMHDLNTSSIIAFAELRGDIVTFYSEKSTQIQNQLSATLYSVQEWAAIVGYLTSELMIQKLNLYTNIDMLTYQIQQTTDPTTQNTLNQLRSGYNTTQLAIPGIISALNTTYQNIQNIYSNISAEQTMRTNFISNRQQMTDIEVNVLQDPTTLDANRQTYVALHADMEKNVIDINASMNNRQRMIRTNTNSIMTVVPPQIIAINALNLGLPFTTPDAIPLENVPFNIDPDEFQVSPMLYGLR